VIRHGAAFAAIASATADQRAGARDAVGHVDALLADALQELDLGGVLRADVRDDADDPPEDGAVLGVAARSTGRKPR
jgi:hypothetical protein